jgi:hypothetical protein
MSLRRFVVVFLVVVGALSLILLHASALPSCCRSNCGGGEDCWEIGDGSCVQNYDHRCDGGECGSYDPYADSCQYYCEWDTLMCIFPPLWPPMECNEVAKIVESCFTP